MKQPTGCGYVWVQQPAKSLLRQKQRRHLVLADRAALGPRFLGYPSWAAAAQPIWRCLRCDFDRCWVFVGDRAVPSMDGFLRFVASRVPFEPGAVLPRLAACTQITLAGPVVRLHAIYERFGGCVCEVEEEGEARRMRVRFAADGGRATITKPLRVARMPGWRAPPGIRQVAPLRLLLTVVLAFGRAEATTLVHAAATTVPQNDVGGGM